MLEAVKLSCVRGERLLFRDVGFALEPGALLQVGGANGAGKTSLLRVLCGLLAPESGEVRWNGAPIGAAREDFHRDLLYIGHAPGIKDDLTAVENLCFQSAIGGTPIDAPRARAALEAAGIGRVAPLPARMLSQGQRRRVALARLELAAPARLWVLDEPFAALDVLAMGWCSSRIRAHVAAGGIVVLTSHQPFDGDAGARRLELGAQPVAA